MQAWKPERAHHDSITGRCVLKMDHYCIWVLNCIGLLNYKAFLLFLAYAFAACTYATAVLARAFVDFLTDGRDATTPCVLLSFSFSLTYHNLGIFVSKPCETNGLASLPYPSSN